MFCNYCLNSGKGGFIKWRKLLAERSTLFLEFLTSHLLTDRPKTPEREPNLGCGYIP